MKSASKRRRGAQRAPAVGFVSLGCPKALVDSEHILTRLRAEGYDIRGSYEDADLVVVNTCGFIDSAVQESLDAIAEALDENGKVIVTGCLGARQSADGANLIRTVHPKVLAVTGPHDTDAVMQAVHEHLPQPHDAFLDLLPPAGLKLTPRHYAYLKISEGCNQRCSFCIIPSMRGDLVSRPIGSVVREAEALVKQGVREILVVSQDTGAYGVDQRYKIDFVGGKPVRTRLFDLVEALGELGVWVRLHYIYPYPHIDEVLPLMAQGKILPYLDIPFQHAHPDVLRRMKRPAAAERTLERIHAWRKVCPDLSIRSTFIAGFPGETEAEFSTLLDFLREAQLDRVGCFAYSPVEGAAANALADPVPEALREERRARLMQLQEDISAQRLARRRGTRIRVLIDAVDATGAAAGRSFADAPEIDGMVHIDADARLRTGEFFDVQVDDSDVHDLYGHLPEAH